MATNSPQFGESAVAGLLDAARRGDRAALARLVSLVERGGDPARAVGRLTYPLGGAAYSVGVTGAPGVGKSTLVDRLIAIARAERQEVGVLAVDPSSPFSGGALLGDRVRMQAHVLDSGVFIRSLATRGHLGGLSLAVPEVIRVLDASGLPLILVETVGVGQVELEVAGVTDTTVVVLNPGSGDSIQANKAGLLEVADVFVVNKADRPGAAELHRDLTAMLDLSAPGEWRVPIVETVASTGDGAERAWEAICSHRVFLGSAPDSASGSPPDSASGSPPDPASPPGPASPPAASGRLAQRRRERLDDELRRILARRLEQCARHLMSGPELEAVRSDLAARRLDPYDAAERILADLGLDGSGPAGLGPLPGLRAP